MAYPELVFASVTVVNGSANLVASSRQLPESPSQPRTAPAETQTELGRYQENSVKQGIFKASSSSVHLGQQALRNSTRECGTSGLAGVINGKLIYFKLLSSRLWSS